MTEVVIRRTGKGGSGIVIAVIMLAVLIFVRYGPQLAKQDARQRENLERQRLQQHILETTTSEELSRLRKSLEESDAVEKSLERLHNAAEARSQAEPEEDSTPSDVPDSEVGSPSR
ncbi:MAG TPA: hypothetical protein VFV87_16280 [Pirellulaceae bacterium]|nr:hypothetical protein [Pirellulaceae bacterium]